MCKYCKRLEEIRENDRDEFNRIVNSWRRHCYKADVLIDHAINFIQDAIYGLDIDEESLCEGELLVSSLLDWKRKDYVGK